MHAQFCLTLRNPMDLACQAFLSMNFTGKNIRVNFHFLLQGIFPTQKSNWHLWHWQGILLPVSHLGSTNTQIYGSHFIDIRNKQAKKFSLQEAISRLVLYKCISNVFLLSLLFQFCFVKNRRCKTKNIEYVGGR